MGKLKLTDCQRKELHQHLDRWLALADLDAIQLKMAVYHGDEVEVSVFFGGEASDADLICTELKVIADACRTMDTPKSQMVLPYLEMGIKSLENFHNTAETRTAAVWQ